MSMNRAMRMVVAMPLIASCALDGPDRTESGEGSEAEQDRSAEQTSLAIMAGEGADPAAQSYDASIVAMSEAGPANLFEGPGFEFLGYAGDMLEWGWAVASIYDHQVDLNQLEADVGTLQWDVEQLKDLVARADARINQVQLEALRRDVDMSYADTITGLQTINADSSRGNDAEQAARAAANRLNFDSFYNLAILPSGTRFDPRFATPTFVIAVTSWLGIMEEGKVSMNPTFDGVLRSYASRLEGVVAGVRANVACTSVQESNDEQCGPPDRPCARWFCDRYIECSDGITGEWLFFNQTKTSGRCPSEYRVPAPAFEAGQEEQRHKADTHAAIAAQWRAYADMPNTNLALGRPAFDTPSTWVPPGRAVDGNTDGNWWAGSVTHTDNTGQPWWWVDLGSIKHIDEIRLFNRTDCCTGRLSHYQIAVSADSTDGWDGTWPVIVDRSWQDIPDGDGTAQVHPVNVWARWVAVTKTDLDYLSLAEVQVMSH